MRIIGEIEHPNLKITVFSMDNKLSVKFESGLYEQTYKFRSSGNLNTFEDIKKFIDPPFCTQVEEELSKMHALKMEAIMRNQSTDLSEEFDEII